MIVFAPITVSTETDLSAASKALADMFGDDAAADAILKVLEAGQLVTPVQFVLKAQEVLSDYGVSLQGDLVPTVAIPGQELEGALPLTYRSSTVIERLLGEQEGDIPTAAVYSLIDLLSTVDVPDSEEHTALIGEVLCRAVLGITGDIPEEVQLAAGLLHYRNAAQERNSALVDPSAEAAPEGSTE